MLCLLWFISGTSGKSVATEWFPERDGKPVPYAKEKPSRSCEANGVPYAVLATYLSGT